MATMIRNKTHDVTSFYCNSVEEYDELKSKVIDLASYIEGRELEIFDDMTKLRFHAKLCKSDGEEVNDR